jgi:hypothetical protein
MYERQHTATPNKKYKECSFLRVIVRVYVDNLIFRTIYNSTLQTEIGIAYGQNKYETPSYT